MLTVRNCYLERNIFLIIKNIKFKKINNYFSIMKPRFKYKKRRKIREQIFFIQYLSYFKNKI